MASYSKTGKTQSFQEASADLRMTPIGNFLPLPPEILQGRNLIMGKVTVSDMNTGKAI